MIYDEFSSAHLNDIPDKLPFFKCFLCNTANGQCCFTTLHWLAKIEVVLLFKKMRSTRLRGTGNGKVVDAYVRWQLGAIKNGIGNVLR